MTAFKKTAIVLCTVLSLLAVSSCSDTEKKNVSDTKTDDKTKVSDTVKDSEENSDKENDSNKSDVKKDNNENKQTEEEIDALAKEALEKMAVLPEYPDTYPTLDDVVAQYEKANMAVGWIVGTEKVATNSDDTITRNGMTYNRVRPDCQYGEHELSHHASQLGETQKLIYNGETFEAYLATLVSADEAHEYYIDATEKSDVFVPRFATVSNGALYALPYSYEPSGFGKEEYSLSKIDNDHYSFTVSYERLNDDGSLKANRSYTMNYSKIDGRWVFENFRLIKN